MNKQDGIARVWLLIIITMIKVFSIIFLCALNIDVQKVILHKYKKDVKIPRILFRSSKNLN